MSLPSTFDNMFKDDPFFSQASLLGTLPQRAAATTSLLQNDFFNRGAEMTQSLMKELQQGLPGELFQLGSPLLRQRGMEALDQGEGPSAELVEADPSRGRSDLSVTLEAQGFLPEEIKVKLEGRRLAVVAMKKAQAEEVQSSSSATSFSSFSSSSSQQKGFARKFDLPAHLDLSALSCSLGEDGKLRIHAPAALQPITDKPQAQQPISGEPQAQQPISDEGQGPARFRTCLDIPITKSKPEEATLTA
ncbi:heat shock protein beta-9 [Hypomesus transpacificus]|uniref:heat shock protein beta-9 n=1 Tax=Hypomesus transpacificus TaxID=137520 RepID=UPI001F084CB0|nr:heat shock protein beta-9 [Hypomesus transpacificus]